MAIRSSNLSSVAWMFLALIGAGSCAHAHGAAAFPAEQRLHVLLIGSPHGYDGKTAAECTLLESLTDLRFSVLPVPHDAGDHMADVDGHFGKDPRWIAIRKAEILRCLQQKYDAVAVTADVDDADIERALAQYVTGGGVLIWPAGDEVPTWLANALRATKAAPELATSPLSGMGLAQAGMQLARGTRLLAEGLTVVHAISGDKAPTPLAAYANVGRGRVLLVASRRGSMFPATFAAGVDGDWLWAQTLARLVRFATRGTATPSIIVEAVPEDPEGPPAVERKFRVTLAGPRGVTAHLQQSDMTEQLLLATWHTDGISARPGYADMLARYLRESGFNAVFNFADREILERHNFRQYMEHQGTTRVGIYTFDSRWALVRGRYGFYLQRGGPNDMVMGKGPYQAPGASYVKPPELPLYTALTASGYAPKFVQPAEFTACKVLFLPYVEAVDRETAIKVEQYVRDGGTLVVFPSIAQYDAGGKPYPSYPGAGFDKLLGFTADPDWLMGRYPVEFPGENAAKKAFADAWFLGEKSDKKEELAQQINPPLFFNMSMRIGGHPCHYMPEGRQRLTNLEKDVAVIGRHEDGTPLLTYRRVGRGAAICFNVLLTGESGLAVPVTEATETFRQAIDQLVRRCGVTPDFEFENIRSYGEGISDFVTMQYDLPGTSTRILTLFGDYRGRRADARLRLRSPLTEAYDVVTGEKLVTIMNPTEKAPEAVVVVEPGHWRVLALTTAPLQTPSISGTKTAALGEVAMFTLARAPRTTGYGRVGVYGPDSQLLPHHSRSVALKPNERLMLRLRLDDLLTDATGKATPWIVRYVDAVTGRDVIAQRLFAVLQRGGRIPRHARNASRQTERLPPK